MQRFLEWSFEFSPDHQPVHRHYPSSVLHQSLCGWSIQHWTRPRSSFDARCDRPDASGNSFSFRQIPTARGIYNHNSMSRCLSWSYCRNFRYFGHLPNGLLCENLGWNYVFGLMNQQPKIKENNKKKAYN